MKLCELFEGMDDAEHADALTKTGFWGKAGAGCIFLARDTGRFLIAHRSRHVEQPGTWGTIGGAIDSGETPIDAVRREAYEETGYKGHIDDIIPLYVFRSNSFKYSNFVVVVEKEFEPHLDWETQGYRWCEWGEWPKPMHFGLQSLLNDPNSVAKLKELVDQAKETR